MLGGRLALRLVAAIAPIVGLVLILRATGVLELFEVEPLRALVERAGVLRIPLFIAAYGLGILAYVPGVIFIAVGVIVFGPEWGLVWCYLGALVGNLSSFAIARWTGARVFGGRLLGVRAGVRPIERTSWSLVDRLFARLSERPIVAVTLIRSVFPTTAPINYALALTDVPFSAYLIGSLVGVLPQLLACIALLGFAFA